jgi:hypothetical protein
MTAADLPVISHPEFSGDVGIGRTDITPPTGIYSRSWGCAEHDTAEGIHRPLLASCVLLAGGEPRLELYLLTLDLGWWYDNAHEREIRDAILKAAGIRDDQLIVHMGHTHSGPITNLQNVDRAGGHLIPAYREHVIAAAAQAIRDAKANVQPATVTWGTGSCRLARNRDLVLDSETFLCGINPEAESDDTLLVARITDAGDRIIGTMVNYACHPVSLGGGNKLISPDYIGGLREIVERETGAPCIFLHGASGDLTPLRSYESDAEIADRNGRQIGYAAMSVLTGLLPPQHVLAFDRIEESGAKLARWSPRPRAASTRLTVTRAETDLPYADLPSEAEIMADLAACTERYQRERLERRLMMRRDLGEGTGRRASLTIWQIGDGFLVAAPAEPYSRFQMELRRRFPRHAVMALNIANGNIGYLAPAETYGKPGLYQIRISLFRPGCLEQVVEETAKTLQGLTNG